MNFRISKQIKIEDKTLWVDEQVVFKSEEETTSKVLKSIYKHLEIKYPKYHKMDLLCKLGFLGAEALLKDTDIQEKYRSEEVAIVLSNANSTINIDTEFYKTIADKENFFPSPAQFVYTLPNIVIGEIAIRNNFKGEMAFLVQKEYDKEMVNNYLSELFSEQGTKACIAGWVDVNEKNEYKTILFLAEKTE